MRHLHLLLVTLALILSPVPAAASEPHVVGEAVAVEWHGSWWLAHVIALIPGDRVAIHYDGWGDEWDEIVGATRIMHPSSNGRLMVEWHGSWWPASIVRPVAAGQTLIHYDGWGPEWDEVVDGSRMKRFATTATRALRDAR
jgi:hypothetical protein